MYRSQLKFVQSVHLQSKVLLILLTCLYVQFQISSPRPLNSSWLRLREACIGCIWIFSFLFTSYCIHSDATFNTSHIKVMVFQLDSQAYCTHSTLLPTQRMQELISFYYSYLSSSLLGERKHSLQTHSTLETLELRATWILLWCHLQWITLLDLLWTTQHR
jgi:hypothetical protein